MTAYLSTHYALGLGCISPTEHRFPVYIRYRHGFWAGDVKVAFDSICLSSSYLTSHEHTYHENTTQTTIMYKEKGSEPAFSTSVKLQYLSRPVTSTSLSPRPQSTKNYINQNKQIPSIGTNKSTGLLADWAVSPEPTWEIKGSSCRRARLN